MSLRTDFIKIKEKRNWKRDIKRYFLGLFCFWVFLFVLWSWQKHKFKNIIENGNYTIAKVISHENGSRRYSGTYFYEYSINDVYLKKGISDSYNNIKIGNHYLVIYENGNPKNSMLLPFYPIDTSSIKNSPKNGWKNPPFELDQKRIANFFKNY